MNRVYLIVYSFLGYTLIEGEYCPGTAIVDIYYKTFTEADAKCKELEECSCIMYSGCDDDFAIKADSGTASSSCNPPSKAYVSMIKLFQNISKWNEFFESEIKYT